MDEMTDKDEAIELLQQLGLKEYEAKSFVALSRRQRGTAKEVSEGSEVPRTRVYDAVRALESKGLVETQHSNPQVFRAVSVDEAVNTLQSEYINRTRSLRSALGGLESPDEDEGESTHEVWSLSGNEGITTRTGNLIKDATDEVILVVGHESVFTDRLAEQLRTAGDRGVNVIVGTVDEQLQTEIRDALPDIEVFVSGLDWLSRSPLPGDETEISRLLLVDRQAILVSSSSETGGKSRKHEQAVFGRGFDNGLVTIARRLMATGLLLEDDPEDGTP
jgi:sugar-specific transcriptional regulator TrmB